MPHLPPADAGLSPDWLTRFGPFPTHPHLAVALSGGADSLALTLLADAWARAQGGCITALTVDHGLRPESRAEAAQVAAWMQQRGVAHQILTPAHTAGSNNLQEAARGWRYDALADWCRANDVLTCLTAHHAGDQRETIALHTARGDTTDGSSGMSAARNFRGVRFLRPLLATEKETLVAYLQAQQMDWIEDPSNRNMQFARVRMRDVLLQDKAQQCLLSATAGEEGQERFTREHAAANAAATLVTLYPSGYAEFSPMEWHALAPDIASGLVADLLTTLSGRTERPRRADTLRLCETLTTPFTRRTLHGCEISLRRGMVRIAREASRVAAPVPLSGAGSLTWDDRFRVHYALPDALTLELRALGANKHGLPRATPSLWHLDTCVLLPHITGAASQLPLGARVSIGFAPAKPLAAAPFWWLK